MAKRSKSTKSANSPHDTPAMRQFHTFKKQHPDCLLLFRMGDFYELFYDDAKIAAKAVGLTLTQRSNGIPMAGVPYHAVEGYLRRLIAAGHRAAICDQIEDPKDAKGVVKRDVTRVVTPGTLTDDALMDEASENPIAAVKFLDDEHAAVAYAELSTGSFHVAEFAVDVLGDELARINPRELLHVETADRKPPERVKRIGDVLGCSLTPRPAWQFRQAEACETLRTQFAVTTLTGFGLDDTDTAIGPAGAIVSYLLETQQAADGRLPHLQPPRRYVQADHLVIDQVSLRSLEIERTLRSGEVSGSLLGTLQDCRTAMGKRTLRHWLTYPLNNVEAISARQDAVAAIVSDAQLSERITDALEEVQDVQRITSRVALGRPSPRDLVALARSLADVDRMLDLLSGTPALASYHERLTAIAEPLGQLGTHLAEACVDDPPAHLRDGGLIRDGYDKPLDEFRSLKADGSDYLARYQAELTEQTGIPSLKLGYNRVFGYYIEVTNVHTEKIPDTFTRKQTLKNAERYITPQLKEYEDKVLGASEKAIQREQHLFDQLCKAVSRQLTELHEYAAVVSDIDVLACFARRAVRFGYVRPTVVKETTLRITDGRHPVLDELLADQFVPNDVDLGVGVSSDDAAPAAATLGLITGPNMAGKSTYIRQAALLTLLAHTGSFVPATEATVGLTDRIFTRIGASDEIHMGQSTFMVEMTETANICHHATPRSLVILDEIGRGTSTLDGLALAWAIAEHLAAKRCRTLFATHYHELTQLAERFDNIANLNVTVREWADQVVFLHRIAPGATDKSYGIHVAQIAGLPKAVVSRARDLMGQLQVQTGRADVATPKPAAAPPSDGQLGLFTEYVEHPAVDALREADVNNMTPMQAFDLLRRLRDELDA
ncbi:MAG: DNA mismatch repair protein MutS [Phycisphaera sp.]|nr:DNA mismatch repair protein MutS [Phycisphaera sp.]